MTIFYFILGAFLRRWYGGCLEDYKILRNRGVQTVCMMAVFMSIYIHDISNWKCWIGALVVSCWLQFEFWSRGHGACFDEGRGIPDEKTIKRYNEIINPDVVFILISKNNFMSLWHRSVVLLPQKDVLQTPLIRLGNLNQVITVFAVNALRSDRPVVNRNMSFFEHCR